MPATYEKIQSTTLGSAATNITFSSIPATYTDLRIDASLTGTGTGYSDSPSRIRFNSDTGSNYSYTYVRGDGSTAFSTRGTNASYAFGYQSGSISGSQPTFYTCDIFSYAGSTNKTCLVSTGVDMNGVYGGYVYRIVNLWRNTSAITSIELSTPNGDNLAVGSTATIYGILKA